MSKMSKNQKDIVKSLKMYEKVLKEEINRGYLPTELRHLIGRIGELKVAKLTNGSFASTTNEPGYDIISSDGKKISVKASASLSKDSKYVFNPRNHNLSDLTACLHYTTEGWEYVYFGSTKEMADNLVTYDSYNDVDQLRINKTRKNFDKTIMSAYKLRCQKGGKLFKNIQRSFKVALKGTDGRLSLTSELLITPFFKNKIINMRSDGMSYKDISSILNSVLNEFTALDNRYPEKKNISVTPMRVSKMCSYIS